MVKNCENCEEEPKLEDRKTGAMEGASMQTGMFNAIMGGLIILMLGLSIFNQFAINDLSTKVNSLQLGVGITPANSAQPAQTGSVSQGSSQGAALSAQQLWSEIAPKGVPAVYGQELGISYDKVEEAMPVMYQFDDYIGSAPIQLSGEKMQRYIAITTSISCEYCCGAKAITSSNGQAACGCAHSGAMRGLAKYLLDKHPEMSNDEILSELGKWKVLYFPDSSVKKAAALKASNLPTDYISLSSNKYRGIEKQVAASGSGSSALPGQVGGC